MKIIDFEKKGNVVRFYLGKDDLKDWYGDDWDDFPYEHNAGRVYDEYMEGYTDVVFPFDDLVLEPADGYSPNTEYCKYDMEHRHVPCVIVVPDELNQQSWYDDFQHWVAAEGITKFYFGDEMAPEYIYERKKKENGWEELIPVPVADQATQAMQCEEMSYETSM